MEHRTLEQAWIDAVPVAEDVAKYIHRRWAIIEAEELSQEFLLRFPEIFESIANHPDYDFELRNAFNRIGKKLVLNGDPLGMKVSQYVRWKEGAHPNYLRFGHASELEFQIDDNDDQPRPIEKSHFTSRMRDQRIDNHECFWCGRLFEMKMPQHEKPRVYCCEKCATAAWHARQIRHELAPLIERFRAGKASGLELEAITTHYIRCLSILKKLGYSFESVRTRKMSNGKVKQTTYYSMTTEGISLPDCDKIVEAMAV